MKIFPLPLIVVLMLSACSATNKYQTFVDWDSNDNNQVERREFVDAYQANGYFKKWSNAKYSVTYQELFNSVFESLDADKDNKLSIVEFNSQIKLFYFGLFNETLDRWDLNSDASIDQGEFNERVSSTNLGSIWDTDNDKRITEGEMAGGMFYICDADSNGQVSETELNAWKRNR